MAKKPAYMVIGDELREQIVSQELPAGARLPSERELVDRFGVARMTVRHALDMLQDEGLIERRRGRTGGTFVRATPPSLELTSVAGFEEHFALSGAEVVSTQTTAVPAPSVVAAAFDIPAGTEVFEREVIYASDGQPVLFAAAYTLPGGPEAAGNAPVRREDILTATRATDRECEALGLARGAVVQKVSRSSYAGDQLAEYTLITLRPDAAQLRAVTGA
ncbi:GntR family transcriptional regulator [Corynebacterium sp. Q4381]|uniref:GntR family transcriptional regulator n=1 Tax=Corynebacterium sp. Marseille-Q4381 TaxID=3121597 RepID=UPI002FE63E57